MALVGPALLLRHWLNMSCNMDPCASAMPFHVYHVKKHGEG